MSSNPDRPIDRAFAKIWAAYESDSQTEEHYGYSRTRIAIAAAIYTAMHCEDSIVTEWHYAPGSNEIVVRLRNIGIPTEDNIRYAQEAVKSVLGWEEKLEKLIEIGGRV